MPQIPINPGVNGIFNLKKGWSICIGDGITATTASVAIPAITGTPYNKEKYQQK